MAEKKASRLGAGLSTLFGEDPSVPEEEIRTLPVSRIEPRKGQPRRDFDPEALDELTESIREYGVIQPITVRPLDKGYYQIIAGERRWRAARAAGLAEVPVRILAADDRLAAELALVENVQREDLNPIEEAFGYRKLMDEFSLTQEDVALRVQKSRPAVANALRLLNLPESLRDRVADGSLSAGHARALLALKSPALQEEAAGEILRKGLNVRQAEGLAAAMQKRSENEDAPGKAGGIVVDYTREAERDLTDVLGRAVRISGGKNRGRISLAFYSADDREALMTALRRMEKPWKRSE